MSSSVKGTVALGLDVGDARIGVARGEHGSSFVFPRGAIRRQGTRHDVERVAELVAAEGAAEVVVGLPLSLDGNESAQTLKVRNFSEALAQRLQIDDVRVVMEDERLTTRIAQRQVGSGPLPRAKRQAKGRLDEASAVLILETYLRRQESGS